MNATAKQESAEKILDALPDDASLEQIQYHLYVVQDDRSGACATPKKVAS